MVINYLCIHSKLLIANETMIEYYDILELPNMEKNLHKNFFKQLYFLNPWPLTKDNLLTTSYIILHHQKLSSFPFLQIKNFLLCLRIKKEEFSSFPNKIYIFSLRFFSKLKIINIYFSL